MGPRALINRLHDQPFRPFRIKVSDASSIEVLEPGMVIVSPTSAVVPIEYVKDEYGQRLVLRWRTIALSHMVSFTHVDAESNGSRSKK